MKESITDPVLEKLRFPIGRFEAPEQYTPARLQQYIKEIAALPEQIRQAVSGMTDPQLDTPYRPDGWTSRQVVHHLADSHINSYVRFKLGLTEDHPTIRPYHEALWAALPDGKHAPVGLSLAILEAIHQRWVLVLQHISPEQLTRTLHHPEYNTTWSLQQAMAIYAWHGKHHLAHITTLKQAKGW